MSQNGEKSEVILELTSRESSSNTSISTNEEVIGVENGRNSSVNTWYSQKSTSSLAVRSYSRWSPTEEGVTIAWRDLSIYVQENNGRCKRIIDNVSGAVKAGTLLALMGSSGAGKSTLMRALAHKSPGGVTIDGDILINGRPIGSFMKCLSGFMHQEELFVSSLTVWEHMNIMANLKMDSRLTSKEKKDKIFTLLRNLGLQNCLHTKIGGKNSEKSLSGGEKRRLSFASELLTDPPLLFCDEPTTGLDSFSAQKLVSMMNAMVSQGRTIICTIHQPSSQLFAMFSQVLLLAEGRIAFMGSVHQAGEFFKMMGYPIPSNYNPADHFIKTLTIMPGSEDSCKLTVRKMCDYFAVSDAAKEVEVVQQYEFHMGRTNEFTNCEVRKDFKATNWWMVMKWLSYRTFLECIRDPSVQILGVIQKIGIAIMTGLCYLGTDPSTQLGVQAVQGTIFLFVSENTFSPMYSVLNVFPRQLPLFFREYKSGLYSTPVYYVSKAIGLLPGLIIEPAVFTAILYTMAGLRLDSYRVLMTVLVSIVLMNVSAACGCFFSTAFNSVPKAMTYLVPFDNYMMITSGIFIKLSTLPFFLRWSKYLSWLMYSNEAMSIIQWEGVSNISCLEVANETLPCLSTGEDVLGKFNFSVNHLTMDFVSLFLLYLSFHILAMYFLHRKTMMK